MQKSDLTINFKEKPEVWDGFVASSSQRSIYVQSKFLDALGVKYDLVTCYLNDQIIAGTVILLDDKTPVQSIFPFVEFQGILLSDKSDSPNHSKISNELTAVEYLLEELVKKYKKFCIANSWRLTDMRPFDWLNYHDPDQGRFQLNVRYTGVLEVGRFKDFDQYLMTVRSCRRQEFNKANKSLKIEEIGDENILDELHEKTFNRQGLTRSEEESKLLKSITRKALDEKYGRLTVVQFEGKPVAANLFIFDDRSGYYLFGANDPDHRNLGAGTLLLGDAIRDCFSKKMSEVDFVGVNSPNRGDFKLSFNGELKPYFVATFPKDS